MSLVPYVVEQTSRGERSYDIFSRLLNDQTGSGAVDLFGQDDDTVVEQAGENVVRPLAAACLLDNIRN